MTELLAVT